MSSRSRAKAREAKYTAEPIFGRVSKHPMNDAYYEAKQAAGINAHNPKECAFCANDVEQCHASLDCEARAWLNGYCGPHQPDPRSYH